LVLAIKSERQAEEKGQEEIVGEKQEVQVKQVDAGDSPPKKKKNNIARR